jgi:ketosteroid isomerase-like protein
MTSQQAEQEIRQRETRRFEALVRGDTASLEEIMADDAIYTHATGVVETKAEYLAKMKSGEVTYESFVPEELRVRVYGTAAVLNGIARVKAHVGGEVRNLRLLFTDVYVKQGERWRMVAWQSTRLPES